MSDSVLVKMTRAEADLWKAFKAVLREQTARTPLTVPAPGAPAPTPAPNPLGLQEGVCGAPGYKTGMVCKKQKGHGQRHRYEIPPERQHVTPARAWVKETEFAKQSGSRTYKIQVGHPCKVEGQRGMFKVIAIERHAENGRINVEVTNDRSGHSRIFPAEKIIYKRPPVKR